MKTEYIVGGVVLVSIVGYFLVESQLSNAAAKAKAATPPTPPPTTPPPTTYADYQVVTLQIGDSLVGINMQDGTIRAFGPGDSFVYSLMENKAFAAKQLGSSPETYPAGVSYGPSRSTVPVGVFYANSGGVTTRYLTPDSLLAAPQPASPVS